MEFRDATEFKKEIRRLYRTAFPAIERAPLFVLFSKSKRDENDFYAVTDNGKFVGLVYAIKSRSVVYVFFLAVEESMRKKGYGTKILNMIRDTYSPLPIALMIEDTQITDAHNYHDRLLRLEFYKKNGFRQLNIKINEATVDYELLSTEDAVVLDDFLDIMRGFLGKLMFRIIYFKMRVK